MRYPTQDELRELSSDERLQLLEDVRDTLAVQPEALPLSEEHRRELDRRLVGAERSPEAGLSWPEVRQRLSGGS